MKTRIIKTKFWTDPKVSELSLHAQHLLIYLLTCPEINTIGCFEVSMRQLKGLMGVSYAKFGRMEQSWKELEEKGLIVRQDSWIFVTKAPKHNRYWVSEKLQETVRSEIAEIPSPLKEIVIKALEDSTIDSTMHSTYKQKTINHKQKKERNPWEKEDSEIIADEVFEALVGKEQK